MNDFKCKLIYIEDNEDEVHIFQKVLKKLGIQIETEYYYDGKSAFEYLNSISDTGDESVKVLVVLDLNLPLITGNEILKRLSKEKKIKKIPIIVFSGSESPKDRELCLSLGVKDFFTKPWSLNGYEDFIKGPLLREFQQICPSQST